MHRSELVSAFERVMGQGSFILRDDLKRFEETMASYLGVNHVVGVNSGTDALYLSTDALGIGQGNEVITVAHSFVATVASIVRRGAKPIFVDVGDDFNMAVEEVEPKITERTKAIMPVHLNGRSCRMDVLEKLANRYDIPVIEDAAQALGSAYQGRKVGSFGLVGCFSLHPLKILSCAGDGGFISTDDDNIAERLRVLRDHGQQKKGEFLCFGYNSRLDNLQAALLNVKFRGLEGDIDRKRAIAQRYEEALSSTPLILPPPPSNGDYFDTFTSYVIRARARDALLDHLRSDGIEVFVHTPKPLYQHEELGLDNIRLENNEKLCKELLSLPIFPEMEDEQVNYVIGSLNRFFRKK